MLQELFGEFISQDNHYEYFSMAIFHEIFQTTM